MITQKTQSLNFFSTIRKKNSLLINCSVTRCTISFIMQNTIYMECTTQSKSTRNSIFAFLTQVEALTGLCDASVFAARSLESPVERFWMLLRGLSFLRRAKAHLNGPEAASMKSPHDGIDGKARGALSEAFRVLRRELLESEEEAGLEEEGRRFLDDFFQFCADEKKRKALLRAPKNAKRHDKQEAIKAAIFGAAPPPSKVRGLTLLICSLLATAMILMIQALKRV